MQEEEYGRLGVGELRKMRMLEEENTRHNRLVAELTLDRHILQEVLRNSLKPTRRRELARWIRERFAVSVDCATNG